MRSVTSPCFIRNDSLLASGHRYLATLFVTLLLSSCSTANWYAGAKASGEAECRKLPAASYEECMRDYDTSYLEYKKQREQAIQK